MRDKTFTLFALCLLIVNCGNLSTEQQVEELNLQLETNSTNLNKRVTVNPSTTFKSNAFETNLNPSYTIQEESTLELVELFHIQSPSEELNTDVSATHLVKSGDHLYIAYHTTGLTYAGGVDALSLNQAQLTSFLYTEDTGEGSSRFEWNSLVLDGNRLAIAGDSPNGAMIMDIQYENGSPILSSKRELALSGVSANAIAPYGTSYYVSVGGNTPGGIAKIQKDNSDLVLDAVNTQSTTGMKYLAIANNQLVAFKGRFGASVMKFDASSNIFDLTSPNQTLPLGYGNVDPIYGKNDVIIHNSMAYVALGKQGLGMIDLNTFNQVDKVALSGSTHSAYADDEYIYIASGERFHILDANSKDVVQTINYDTGSANYVMAFDHDFNDGEGAVKVIALACGKEGVRILKLVTSPPNPQSGFATADDEYVFSGLHAHEGNTMVRVDERRGAMLFHIHDEAGNVIDSLGADLWGTNIFVQFGDAASISTYFQDENLTTYLEEDEISGALEPSNLNINPSRNDFRITARYRFGNKGIFSVDNRKSDEFIKMVVKNVGTGDEVVLVVPPNARLYTSILINTSDSPGNTLVPRRFGDNGNLGRTASLNASQYTREWSGLD